MGKAFAPGPTMAPLLLVVLAIALVALVCAGTTSATDIHVPSDYPTVQEAVDNATAGDRIIIGAGTFEGPVVVSRPMTLAGNGIQRTIISGEGGFVLNLVGPRLQVYGLTVVGTGSTHGIMCTQFSEGQLSHIAVQDCLDGLRLDRSYGNSIANCRIENSYNGISMLNGSHNNTFHDVTCSGNDHGLDLGNVFYWIQDSENTFHLCSFIENRVAGLVGRNAPETTFAECDVRLCVNNALLIMGRGCQVVNSTIGDNLMNGIVCKNDVTVTGCSVYSNGDAGMVLTGTSRFQVSNTVIYGNWAGIYLISSADGHISNVDVSKCEYGIYISQSSDRIIVEGSTFSDCSISGARVSLRSDRVTFDGCQFDGNFRGVEVSQSSNTVLEDCTLMSNRMDGVYCNDAPGTSLRGCTVQWTGLGGGVALEVSPDAIVYNCTILHNNASGLVFISSGEDRLMRVIVRECVISYNDGEGIDLDYAKGSLIADNRIENNLGIGIDALYMVDSTIDNNTLAYNGQGIDLEVSNGNVVSRNTIRRNSQEGIRLRSSGTSSANTIANNSIAANSWNSVPDHAGLALVDIYSNHNVVEYNELLNNPLGILLESEGTGCMDNIVRHNTLRQCSVGAVVTRWYAGPNTFYLNSFLSNEVQVTDVHGGDVFHNGTLGNYWDDYLDRYPGTLRDGAVWVRPYQLVQGIEVYDPYPLAFMYEADPPVARLRLEENVTFGYRLAIDGSRSWDATAIAQYNWVVHPLDGSPRSYSTKIPYLDFIPMLLGEHRVTLSVQDVWGNWGTTSGWFKVVDDEPPDVVAGPDMVVDVGEEFQLSAAYVHENHQIAALYWTVDPGGLDIFVPGSAVRIAITKAGVYEAVIYAEDKTGNSDTDSLLIHVLDREPPIAKAGNDVDAAMGESVTLDGGGSSDNVGIVKWTWTFRYRGISHALAGERAKFTFEDPGQYTITMTVVDADGNAGMDEVVVRVHDTVPPVAVAGKDQEVGMGETVILDASASSDNIGISRYEWSIRQYPIGSMSQVRVSYTFEQPGVLRATLYVYDAEGNWDSDEVVITVLDTEAPVAIINMPRTLVLGTTIALDGTGSRDNVEVTDHRWTVRYGDKSKQLSGELAEFTFSSPGYYDIKLTVFDDAGNTGEATFRTYVPAAVTEEPGTASWVLPAVAIVLVSVLLVGVWLSLVRWRTE